MSAIIYWQPVLLASVLVFAASAVVWMFMPWHKSDFAKTPDEAAARDALKGIEPGAYMLPYCIDPKELEQDDNRQKFADGPVAYFFVQRNGIPELGGRLIKVFAFYLAVSGLCAYVVNYHAAADYDYLDVYQLTGTVAFAAYGIAHVQDSIWFAKPWSITIKNLFDAFLYSMLTAGAFAWLV